MHRKQAEETASSIKSSLELMDQTDGQEKLIKSLASMIEEKRLKVKVYTRGRLHAKAYIFDYNGSSRWKLPPADRISRLSMFE